jgi:hypothetical protein
MFFVGGIASGEWGARNRSTDSKCTGYAEDLNVWVFLAAFFMVLGSIQAHGERIQLD